MQRHINSINIDNIYINDMNIITINIIGINIINIQSVLCSPEVLWILVQVHIGGHGSPLCAACFNAGLDLAHLPWPGQVLGGPLYCSYNLNISSIIIVTLDTIGSELQLLSRL